jgi:hypothetical protein
MLLHGGAAGRTLLEMAFYCAPETEPERSR